MAESKLGIRAECGTSLAEFNPQASNYEEGGLPKVFPRKNPLIVGNREFRPITDFELSDEELDKARLELGETDQKRRDCLQELKKMLTNGKIRYQADDSYLLRYLRFKKFDCKKTYNTLKKVYQWKKNTPELFKIPERLKHQVDANVFTISPYSDEKGRIVVLMDVAKWNYEEEPIEDVIRAALCIFDVTSMNPRCQVNGIIGIWDVKDVGPLHFSIVLKWFRTFLSLLVDFNPWRLKIQYFLNTGPFFRMLYNMARPFLPRKMKDRIFVLGSDFSVLHENVNPEILPIKFGGKLEDEECSVSHFVYENLHSLQRERSFV